MKLRRVQLRDYRGVRQCDVSLRPTGVTIIEGPNEIGKSSICEAVQLAVEFPDSSRDKKIRALKPAGRDEGPQVDIELSLGGYELQYCKRWLRAPQTILKITAPSNKTLTGREAHDRLKAIIEATLDAQLWAALRIEQGKDLTLPGFNLPALGRALDRAAAGDAATEREDALWDRISAEYHKYWTPKGQQRSDRSDNKAQLDQARATADELDAQLAAAHHDAEQLDELDADAQGLKAAVAECKDHQRELAEQWQSTQTLLTQVDALTAGRDAGDAARAAAKAAQRRRLEIAAAALDAAATLAGLESESERIETDAAAAGRVNAAAAEASEKAHAAHQVAQGKHRAAAADLEHLRSVKDAQTLKQRHDRYCRAAEALTDAQQRLASAQVTAEAVTEIERAHLDHERAKAAADIVAAAVTTTALSDIKLRINDAEAELLAGNCTEVSVHDETTLTIAGIAELRVDAGSGAKHRAVESDRAQQHYRQLCEQAAVGDVAEAKIRHQQRLDAQRDGDEAQNAIKESLGDITIETLRAKIEHPDQRPAPSADTRPEGTAAPDDIDAAAGAASRAERDAETVSTEREAKEGAAATARDALTDAQTQQHVIAARIEDARSLRDQTQRRLAEAQQGTSDVDVADALSDAETAAAAARTKLGDAQAALDAAAPQSQLLLMDNAAEGTKRAIEASETNADQRRKLRISLELRGEMGLHSAHSDAANLLSRSERRHERVEQRAAAAALLQDIFDKHRRAARQRYMGPFKERIDLLGKIVFGQTFAVELSEHLEIVRRYLDGVTLDIEQLSTGAREQIGVLSRLACAMIVSPTDGGVPVIVDDALGWSDPARLRTMGAAIRTAGEHCQIIVLTCTPGRYSSIKNAKVVALSHDSATTAAADTTLSQPAAA